MNIFNRENVSNDETIVYTSMPLISELCCIKCNIDYLERRDSSGKSNFHWMTMKCRLLIYLIPNLIAAPIFEAAQYIYVIVSKEYLTSGNLLNNLRTLKLIYYGPEPITSKIYKDCISYTIQCKITPRWNRISQYLIQGKEFYNAVHGITNSIQFDICIDESDVSLQLRAKKINVSYIRLEDYQLPESAKCQFLADPKGEINLSEFGRSAFVYVIPSMKRAKLVSICKKISEGSVFKDYAQLRRHWKNMYGYSLPKNENEIFYCQVKFSMPHSTVFTYPNICITTKPLDVRPNSNKESVIGQFLSDMLITVPSVCGKRLKISHQKSLNVGAPKYAELPSCDGSESSSRPTPRLEFSVASPQRKLDESNIITTQTVTLKKHLLQLQKIHNVTSGGCTSSNRNDRGNFLNDTQSNVSAIQTTQDIISKDKRNENSNSFQNEEENVSKYFGDQNSHTHNAMDQAEDKTQQNLRLTKKLLNAINRNNINRPLVQEKNQNTNVEEMARNNKLSELKLADLSKWLKEQSIPHNSRGKKMDLIAKVILHLKNKEKKGNCRV